MNTTSTPVITPETPQSALPAILSSIFVVLFLVSVSVSVFVVVYRKRGHGLKSMWRRDTAEHGKKEDNNWQAEQRAASHQYTTMGSLPCAEGNSAIYENYTGQPAQDRNSMVTPRGPDEDLYLQCDSADEVIYNNDPACSLAMLPEPHEEEDLYIMPDSP
ncbi:hypothetical protein NHX12_004132 [Muraenolepis orangiensis]|uniref:Uncharacterized protein n=1 Tax=Muraenolepis orangiensis TaxID=630683 RepID=A0A9Q0DYF9_9TELE|nr:hypothetical protein NHX12_004132 [Muraenolepis orangiensis]